MIACIDQIRRGLPLRQWRGLCLLRLSQPPL
jgi:hypothetical protein